jgi:hypothetical protein
MDPSWANIIPPQNTPHHPHVHAPLAIVKKPITLIDPRSGQPVLRSGNDVRDSHEKDPEDNSLSGDAGQRNAKSPRAQVPSIHPDRLGISLNKYACDKRAEGQLTSTDNPLPRLQASSYVPQWLVDLPSPETVVQLPPLPSQPPADYAANFLSLPLIRKPFPDITASRSILSMPAFPPTTSAPSLEDDADTYLRHWNALLSLELASLQETAGHQKLFRITISQHHTAASRASTSVQAPTTWKVSIPGIREDSPRIQTGDVLLLRGLYPELHTASRCAIEARVTGYIKRDGVIFVEAPELQLQATFLPKTAEGLTEWAVEFRASSEAACVMQNAVRRWEGREHRLGSLPLTLTHPGQSSVRVLPRLERQHQRENDRTQMALPRSR